MWESCHCFLFFCMISVCARVDLCISSKELRCSKHSLYAAGRSMFISSTVLKVLCSNSMGSITYFPYKSSNGTNLVVVFHVVLYAQTTSSNLLLQSLWCSCTVFVNMASISPSITSSCPLACG